MPGALDHFSKPAIRFCTAALVQALRVNFTSRFSPSNPSTAIGCAARRPRLITAVYFWVSTRRPRLVSAAARCTTT